MTNPDTEVGAHEWSWFTAEWDTLPQSLTQAELNDWEIFAIQEIGVQGRYVKVVTRRRIS